MGDALRLIDECSREVGGCVEGGGAVILISERRRWEPPGDGQGTTWEASWPSSNSSLRLFENVASCQNADVILKTQERSRYVLVLDRGSAMEGGGKWTSLHHALHRLALKSLSLSLSSSS